MFGVLIIFYPLIRRTTHFKKEKAAANYPLIRMFTTEHNTSMEALEECSGKWQVCSPETVGSYSAAAYFFGREIHKGLGVPVGLVHSSWGGTRIESWSPMGSLEQFPAVVDYKAQLDAKAQKFDEATNEARYAKLSGQSLQRHD